MAEWISVKDRLPEKDGEYLCCLLRKRNEQNYYIKIVEYSHGSEILDFSTIHRYTCEAWLGYDSDFGYYKIDNVTHWMPLPNPPKGE